MSINESRGTDNARQVQHAAEALLAAAGQRDGYSVGHSERVAHYSNLLGKHFGLSERELTDLRYAAALHDIGKIGVSRSILNKLGRLADDEVEAMRLHSIIGIRLIEKIEGLKGAVPAIKHHHERWDGQGYPDRLTGDAIPLSARIISVAETYDILTSQLPWRRPMSTTEAAAELRRCASSQFDPAVVEAFIEVVIPAVSAPAEASRAASG